MPLVHTILRYLPIKRGQQITRADDVVNEYGGLAIQNMRSVDGHALNLFGQMLAGNLIVAGSDTTATTLTYLVWAVLKHPYLQNKLEDEIAQLSEELSLAELEAAPILNSVTTEALRLYDAAPGALPRIVPDQGMTVSGHSIPGGVEVSTQAYTSHRDPSIFSEPLS
jgi:cytochrome P450